MKCLSDEFFDEIDDLPPDFALDGDDKGEDPDADVYGDEEGGE